MYTWKSHHIQTGKQGELVCFFFCGRTANGSLQLSSQPIFRKLCETGRSIHRSGGGCSKVTLPSGVWAHSKREQEEKGWAEQHGAFPCCGASMEIFPSLPSSLPKKGIGHYKTPQIFFWPCKTLTFSVPESWKWEYQSLPSCSVKCSMNCSAYGRNTFLLLTIPPCWAVFPLSDNTGNSILIVSLCPRIKLWEGN